MIWKETFCSQISALNMQQVHGDQAEDQYSNIQTLHAKNLHTNDVVPYRYKACKQMHLFRVCLQVGRLTGDIVLAF